MRRFLSLLMLLTLGATSLLAQSYSISGKILDGASTTGESLPGASVALLSAKDSSVVTGVSSSTNGQFKLSTSKSGAFLLRVSYMGYVPQFRSVSLSKDKTSLNVGSITLQENVQEMKETIITGALAQVEMKADTFVYNAEAFRLPEGSTLEALVKKLPGAEVSDDGTITVNGKTVKKIMMDGKEFFSDDTQVAMKNLPSSVVKKIKAYDRQSDYTRVTGIDDGEEETVLDLSVKKGMKEGWMINVDVAGGTEDRYSAKANIMRFDDNFKFMLTGNRNNVGDRGFGGPGGGGSGIQTNTTGALNINWDNGKKDREAGKLELGGSVRYFGVKNNSLTKTNSETFLTETSSTYTNSLAQTLSHSTNVNANFRMEWAPDSMTNIMFRPSYSHSESDSKANSQSVTFNSDPYDAGMVSPLDEYGTFNDVDSIRVNSNDRISYSDSYSNSGSASLQINRRLNSSGRNLTLNVEGSYSKSHSDATSLSLVRYYQSGQTSTNTYQTTASPSKTYSYQARLSYSEPIFKGASLQFSYQIQRRYQDQNRTMLTWEDMTDYLDGLGITDYTAEQLWTGTVAGLDNATMVQDLQNSQYATYKELNHDASIRLRYNNTFANGSQLRLNFGLSFQPQTTHMDYQKAEIDTTVTRHTYNWAPSLGVRWKISNTSQLNLRYRGSMSQPSMTNLIEVMDTSDPLNVSTGNAGLKSSWSDRLNLFYNNFITETQTSYAAFIDFNNTRRSISNATIYDEQTGAKYSRPMNIDGNWSLRPNLMFNTALGKNKWFNISSHTSVGYTHSVGYQSGELGDESRYYLTSNGGSVDMEGLFAHTELPKQVTKQTTVGENLRLNYRRDLGANEDWNVDFGLSGSLNYTHARNNVQSSANMDTWTFSYGGNAQVTTPWTMTLSTDLTKESRRGYDDASMNTNELIWNASLSQSLKKWLKNHDLTISVEWYDILKERSNISRSISATMRSDTYTNAINSYLMVHLIYKLNLMGNRETRREGGPGFGGPGFGGPGGGGPGGGGPGGGGGGRPM